MKIYKLFYELPKKRGADATELVIKDLEDYTAEKLTLVEKPYLYITQRLINKINIAGLMALESEFFLHKCSKPNAFGWFVAESEIENAKPLGKVEKIKPELEQ